MSVPNEPEPTGTTPRLLAELHRLAIDMRWLVPSAQISPAAVLMVRPSTSQCLAITSTSCARASRQASATTLPIM